LNGLALINWFQLIVGAFSMIIQVHQVQNQKKIIIIPM